MSTEAEFQPLLQPLQNDTLQTINKLHLHRKTRTKANNNDSSPERTFSFIASLHIQKTAS